MCYGRLRMGEVNRDWNMYIGIMRKLFGLKLFWFDFVFLGRLDVVC